MSLPTCKVTATTGADSAEFQIVLDGKITFKSLIDLLIDRSINQFNQPSIIVGGFTGYIELKLWYSSSIKLLVPNTDLTLLSHQLSLFGPIGLNPTISVYRQNVATEPKIIGTNPIKPIAPIGSASPVSFANMSTSSSLHNTGSSKQPSIVANLVPLRPAMTGSVSPVGNPPPVQPITSTSSTVIKPEGSIESFNPPANPSTPIKSIATTNMSPLGQSPNLTATNLVTPIASPSPVGLINLVTDQKAGTTSVVAPTTPTKLTTLPYPGSNNQSKGPPTGLPSQLHQTNSLAPSFPSKQTLPGQPPIVAAIRPILPPASPSRTVLPINPGSPIGRV